MLKSIFKYILITLAIAAFGLALVITGVITSTDSQLPVIAVVGMLVILFSPAISGIWFWLKRRKMRIMRAKNDTRQAESKLLNAAEQERKNILRHRFLERKRLIDSVDRHRTTLTRNIQRAIKKNDYGAIISDDRDDALEEFFASIDLDMSAISFEEAESFVYEQLDIRNNQEHEAGFDASNLPFDGHAFEEWVAKALRSFGWATEVTRGSGDQGIDVIAEMNGKKLGIQCKLYSSAVGNKAVQEAHAGKAYYGTDVVGVLSNASYTSSAVDLANVTGVELLSHHDIPDLFEKVFGRE
ncbi:MAG: restriction endonuclease [Paracoccaceae bacterium]